MTLASFVTAVLLLVQAERPTPAPLNEEQVKQLRALMYTTQTTAATLQGQLDEKQRELAKVYAQYELNQRQALRLQSEIMELQKQLLANHHKLQVELRSIVGQERFEMLRLRVLNSLTPKPKDKEPETPPRK
jgi:predicted NACHT family NTPase